MQCGFVYGMLWEDLCDALGPWVLDDDEDDDEEEE